MLKERVKLRLICYDDIHEVNVTLVSKNPYKVGIPESYLPILNDVEKIKVIHNYTETDVKLISIESSLIILEFINSKKKCILEDTDKIHHIDYKGTYTISVIDNRQHSEYKIAIDKINSYYRNNLGMRLKQSLAESDENIDIISYLLDINSKLDEILDIIRPKNIIEGGFKVRGVALSGNWCTFFSNSRLQNDDKVFITCRLSDSNMSFEFASFGRITCIKLNSDNTGIYKCIFEGIDSDVKDEITKYIFAREREKLKLKK